MNMRDYREKVYAGVLGKVIGVYFGRPVEGWPYEKIRQRFGIVDHYVAEDIGIPLHVADDDLAGTFTFLNALEDFRGDLRTIRSEDFGRTWLDYIIENRTLFWWGGLGRSTEHTAYLRLKSGVKAPYSGSIAVNGKGVAEQIGAQIFMDGLALLCPDDPAMARYLVRESASVSHDGMAVESACFLAAMEAMAFSERRMETLMEESLRLSGNGELRSIVESVAEAVSKYAEFRRVRDWLEEHYSYSYYPGNCHVVPNLALITASLLLGGDSFASAMRFCVSAGWDTDCNGANVGVINAVRLGLPAITEEFDFRRAIADRFYCISGNGSAGVTDAVRQTERIVALHRRLYAGAAQVRSSGLEDSAVRRSCGESADLRDENAGSCGDSAAARECVFSFSLPGAVQGFTVCPENGDGTGAVYNASGLVVEVGESGSASASALVMWDPADRHGGYELIASPLLYETQTVEIDAEVIRSAAADGAENNGASAVTPYVVYFDFADQKHVLFGPRTELGGRAKISWRIPENRGYTILRLGLMAEGVPGGRVLVRSIHWAGAPERFSITGSLRNYDLGAPNMQLRAFTASARQFSFDARYTFTISDTEKNGLAVIGNDFWRDYSVRCTVNASLCGRFGIVGRVRGLRRYYAAVLWEGSHFAILAREGENETVLAETDVRYECDTDYALALSMRGNEIRAEFDGVTLTAEDARFSAGGGGFLVDEGTFLASELLIERI